MKLSARIITVFFSFMMLFFSVYQYFLGNPFQDAVNPFFVLVLFFILGITGLIAAFRKDHQAL